MKYFYNGDLNSLAKKLRKQMTKQERHLWYDFLRTYSIKVYRQRVIDNYVADFYCPAAKLVIELDGGQHYDDTKMIEDEHRSLIINQYGIQVLRIPNNEVDNNFDNVCTYLDSVVKKRVKVNSSVRNLLA
ncbi:MAG: endonuclease domain-containing protein [Phascolarctobacterium sp.]